MPTQPENPSTAKASKRTHRILHHDACLVFADSKRTHRRGDCPLECTPLGARPHASFSLFSEAHTHNRRDHVHCVGRTRVADFFAVMRPVLLACVALCACTAQIDQPINSTMVGGPTGPGAEPDPCTQGVIVGSAPLRRLSHEEYGYSLSDIYAQDALTTIIDTQEAALSPDPQSLGFDNSSAFLVVSSTLAQNYMDAAEAVSAQAVTDLTKILPCTYTPATAESACIDQFIQTFGRRMFRRAIATDEAARYRAAYDGARSAGYDFPTGVQFVLFAFMNSPNFLYRIELDAPGSTGTRPLSGLELAARLSYTLWHSTPDETLLAAAEGGQLSTKAQVAAQASRMVADNKVRRAYSFFNQWLQLQPLTELLQQRDPTAFPNLDPMLPTLFDGETQAFVNGVVFDGDSTVKSLLTAPFTYVNAELATHYGLTGVTGTDYVKTAQKNDRRGGLFMLGGVLAVHDKSTRTSIVRRGLTVRTQVMCQIVPAPPPNIPALGEVDANTTQAQLLAEHRTNPACASCHDRMDPLGSAFEAIDGVGRDRTVDEGGHPVVTTGAISGSENGLIDGNVTDAMDMMTKFASSTDAQDCIATQLYRFAAGREEETADACSRYQLRQGFQTSGGNIKALLTGLTATDDFFNRQVTPP